RCGTGILANKARGLKKHLKRLNAPKHWMLDKLGGAFKNKNDGIQTMNPPRRQVCSPLVINVLLLTMTVETKAMIRRNMRMNLHHHKVHFPILLPLTLMTGKMRPMMWRKRRFTFMLCKVRSVQFGQKGIPCLNTYDDRTIRYPDPLIKANDTIKIDLETNKIMDFIKFDVGNVVM
ncbi:hypothetical protein ACJX0J_024756, partial [Zea mays]